MAIFITLIVAMIDIDLFGWMYICGISLDLVTYTQCVMAVGLTVDYVIHITHAISDASPKITPSMTNNDIFIARLKIAMKDMGASVVKGAFTTFLGAIALVFSQSEAFRTFFYMFSGIIIVAVAHGLILTPALMGEFKFIYCGLHEENYKNKGIVSRRVSGVTINQIYNKDEDKESESAGSIELEQIYAHDNKCERDS